MELSKVELSDIQEAIDNALPYLMKEGISVPTISKVAVEYINNGPSAVIKNNKGEVVIVGGIYKDSYAWAIVTKRILECPVAATKTAVKWFKNNISKNINRIETVVSSSERTKEATRWAKVLGFRLVRSLPNFYQSRSNALLMVYNNNG